MNKIRILPQGLRNRIAAGEVIERPASVVKELIENSIDAQAKRIEIQIEGGGKRLIVVSDDGIGIPSDELHLAVEPHATSKIESEEDLFNIRTRGFRGEALASIASVSRLRITSQTEGEAVGRSIYMEGGRLLEDTPSPHRGTTVEVKDLFFNTPARRKFLKSDRTEIRHIIDTVTETALSEYNRGFRLSVNNTETLHCPQAGNLRERLLQVYGEEFISGLHLIELPHLQAFFSKEDNFRINRSHQYIFINGRPIRDASLRHAVYSAYERILPHDRHPIFFLFLQVPPSSVDFNVHPAKREVRFSDKEGVYRMVRDSLREVLLPSSHEHVKPLTPTTSTAIKTGAGVFGDYQQDPPSAPPSMIEEPVSGYGHIEHIYLGDVFLAYSDGEGLTLLDHHAAHERVIYEKLLKGMDIGRAEFLFPRQITLSPSDYTTIIQNIPTLEAVGFSVEDFGSNSVLVRSIPAFVSEDALQGILEDLAESIRDISANSPVEELRKRLAMTIACHRSVRGKKRLTGDELRALLEDMEKLDDPEHCPHGRPTRLRIGIDELKRMFKRT